MQVDLVVDGGVGLTEASGPIDVDTCFARYSFPAHPCIHWADASARHGFSKVPSTVASAADPEPARPCLRKNVELGKVRMLARDRGDRCGDPTPALASARVSSDRHPLRESRFER